MITETPNSNLRRIFDEKWKTYPKADYRVDVSNYGRIRSYGNKNIPEGKLIKPSLIKGYKCISLKVNGIKKTLLIHKLVAELFVAKKDGSYNTVIHRDWNKTNNYYNNLEWCSKKESSQRSLSKARINKCSSISNSKLCEQDVCAIKKMLAKGHKQKVIAKLFCVSETQISRIKNNSNWTKV